MPLNQARFDVRHLKTPGGSGRVAADLFDGHINCQIHFDRRISEVSSPILLAMKLVLVVSPAEAGPGNLMDEYVRQRTYSTRESGHSDRPLLVHWSKN